MSGRLREDTLMRFVDYGVNTLGIVAELERGGRPRRVVDQMIGSGTSSGANAFEAAEAMSTPDFLKCLGISAKELNENRFWLLVVSRAKWIAEEKCAPLIAETLELLAIIKAIIVRTKTNRSREQ